MPFSWKALALSLVGLASEGAATESADADADATPEDAAAEALLASLSAGKPRLAPHTADAKFTEEKVAEAVAKARAEAAKAGRDALVAAYRTQAQAFLAAEVKAGRVLPADSDRLALLYADFALADQESPITADVNGKAETYSRLGHFTAEIGQRGSHQLTTERIPADAKSLPESLKGLKVLEAASTDPKDAGKADGDMVLSLLKGTDEGRAILAALAKSSK